MDQDESVVESTPAAQQRKRKHRKQKGRFSAPEVVSIPSNYDASALTFGSISPIHLHRKSADMCFSAPQTRTRGPRARTTERPGKGTALSGAFQQYDTIPDLTAITPDNDLGLNGSFSDDLRRPSVDSVSTSTSTLSRRQYYTPRSNSRLPLNRVRSHQRMRMNASLPVFNRSMSYHSFAPSFGRDGESFFFEEDDDDEDEPIGLSPEGAHFDQDGTARQPRHLARRSSSFIDFRGHSASSTSSLMQTLKAAPNVLSRNSTSNTETMSIGSEHRLTLGPPRDSTTQSRRSSYVSATFEDEDEDEKDGHDQEAAMMGATTTATTTTAMGTDGALANTSYRRQSPSRPKRLAVSPSRRQQYHHRQRQSQSPSQRPFSPRKFSEPLVLPSSAHTPSHSQMQGFDGPTSAPLVPKHTSPFRAALHRAASEHAMNLPALGEPPLLPSDSTCSLDNLEMSRHERKRHSASQMVATQRSASSHSLMPPSSLAPPRPHSSHSDFLDAVSEDRFELAEAEKAHRLPRQYTHSQPGRESQEVLANGTTATKRTAHGKKASRHRARSNSLSTVSDADEKARVVGSVLRTDASLITGRGSHKNAMPRHQQQHHQQQQHGWKSFAGGLHRIGNDSDSDLTALDVVVDEVGDSCDEKSTDITLPSTDDKKLSEAQADTTTTTDTDTDTAMGGHTRTHHRNTERELDERPKKASSQSPSARTVPAFVNPLSRMQKHRHEKFILEKQHVVRRSMSYGRDSFDDASPRQDQGALAAQRLSSNTSHLLSSQSEPASPSYHSHPHHHHHQQSAGLSLSNSSTSPTASPTFTRKEGKGPALTSHQQPQNPTTVKSKTGSSFGEADDEAEDDDEDHDTDATAKRPQGNGGRRARNQSARGPPHRPGRANDLRDEIVESNDEAQDSSNSSNSSCGSHGNEEVIDSPTDEGRTRHFEYKYGFGYAAPYARDSVDSFYSPYDTEASIDNDDAASIRGDDVLLGTAMESFSLAREASGNVSFLLTADTEPAFRTAPQKSALLVSRSGTVLSTDARVRQLLPFKSSELVGKSLLDILSSCSHARLTMAKLIGMNGRVLPVAGEASHFPSRFLSVWVKSLTPRSPLSASPLGMSVPREAPTAAFGTPTNIVRSTSPETARRHGKAAHAQAVNDHEDAALDTPLASVPLAAEKLLVILKRAEVLQARCVVAPLDGQIVHQDESFRALHAHALLSLARRRHEAHAPSIEESPRQPSPKPTCSTSTTTTTTTTTATIDVTAPSSTAAVRQIQSIPTLYQLFQSLSSQQSPSLSPGEHFTSFQVKNGMHIPCLLRISAATDADLALFASHSSDALEDKSDGGAARPSLLVEEFIYPALSGTITVSSDGTIQHAHPRFVNLMLGMQLDDVVGKNISLFLPDLSLTPADRSSIPSPYYGVDRAFPDADDDDEDDEIGSTRLVYQGNSMGVQYQRKFFPNDDLCCLWLSRTLPARSLPQVERGEDREGDKGTLSVRSSPALSENDVDATTIGNTPAVMDPPPSPLHADAATANAANVDGNSRNSSRCSVASIQSPCTTGPEPQVSLASAGRFSELYRILGELGSGAFGTVVAGKRLSDDEPVVVKFIRKDAILEEAWCTVPPAFRFKAFLATMADDFSSNELHPNELPTEVAILGSVQHPHIVEMMDVFQNDDFYQIVMASCEPTVDMFKLVDLISGMPEDLASHFLRQLASALQYLHDQQILHRDIKDENVIVTMEGDVYLIDFGSSCMIRDDGDLFDVFCGTIEYCAPEAFLEDTYSGKEMDVYALGVTLYSMLYGEHPFFTPEEAVQGIDYVIPPLPTTRDCLELVRGLLARDPKTRLTMAQVMQHPWCTMDVHEGVAAVLANHEWALFFQEDCNTSQESFTHA